MTRYRQKMRRGIIIFLAEEGPSKLGDIASAMGRDPRVIRNYLRHFTEDFELRGKFWHTTRALTKKGQKGWVEVEGH